MRSDACCEVVQWRHGTWRADWDMMRESRARQTRVEKQRRDYWDHNRGDDQIFFGPTTAPATMTYSKCGEGQWW